MKIGNPNHPRKNLLKEIKRIGKGGFDFVDLFLEEDMAVPEKINIKKTKEILKKYNLGVVGHTAWYLPISSPIKSIRDSTVDEVERYLKTFNGLGVKKVTIHANWGGGLFSIKEILNFQIYTLNKIVKRAKKYNIRIMLEPIETKYDNIKNISKIMNKVKGLYLLLDIGHANVSENKIENWIKKFNKKIIHIHLHDNNGKEDQHLSMGKGNIKWEKVIKVLKKYYNKTITLEVFEGNKYTLLSKTKLKKLWENA